MFILPLHAKVDSSTAGLCYTTKNHLPDSPKLQLPNHAAENKAMHATLKTPTSILNSDTELTLRSATFAQNW